MPPNGFHLIHGGNSVDGPPDGRYRVAALTFRNFNELPQKHKTEGDFVRLRRNRAIFMARKVRPARRTGRWRGFGVGAGVIGALAVAGAALMVGIGEERTREYVTRALHGPVAGDSAETTKTPPEGTTPTRLVSSPVLSAEPGPVRPGTSGEHVEGGLALARTTPAEPEESVGTVSGAVDSAVGEELRFEIRPGDSLSALFQARGLPQRDLHGIVSSDERVKRRLSALRSGDHLRIRVDGAASVSALSHSRGDGDALRVERQSDGEFLAHWAVAPASAPNPEAPEPAPVVPDPTPILTTGLAEHGWARREIEVASGDSLYGIFVDEDLSVSELVDLLRSGDDSRFLKRLLPGQRLDFYLDEPRSLRYLVFHRDEMESLHFFRNEGGFASAWVENELDRRLASASGEIRSSFYLAAQQAGLSDRLIMEVAEIFAWDVDFALDIRDGDRFNVIYEELYQPDGTASDGAILAAEFVNRGQAIRALRYEDDHGRASYYSPEGFSMRKAFLRAPVNFTRISSRFGPRTHPLLHRLLQHNGVDYAAPSGTPVKATSDGKVAHVGRKGGYGKTVMLKHGALYTTVYAHLSRYANGLTRGDSVLQGQIIGYVGSTGLATGPHLHYEFRVRGRHRDPLKTQLPKAAPIAPEYRTDFFNRTRGLVARLDNLSTTQLVSRD